MFTKYENGAEVEISEVHRYENGAEVQADAVYRVKNGAEEEIWSNVKLLSLYYETVSNCHVISPTEWGEWTNMWAMNEDGYIIYTAKGEFNNPKIAFNYEGYYYYWQNGYDRFDTVGSLYAYGKKADGSIEEILVSETINTRGTSSTLGYYGFFTGGDYTEIGFKFVWTKHELENVYDENYHFAIKNIEIDGKKYITDPADDFEQGTL